MQLLPNESTLRTAPAQALLDEDLGALRPGWRTGTLQLTDRRLAFRESGPLGAHHDLLLRLHRVATEGDAILKTATERVPIDGHPLLVLADAQGVPRPPDESAVTTFRARWLGLIPHGGPAGIVLIARNVITGAVGELRYRLDDAEAWAEALRAAPP